MYQRRGESPAVLFCPHRRYLLDMQYRSIRLVISLFAVVLAACDEPLEPIVPCSGACAGLQLTIDSVRAVLPDGRTTAFSGDTIRVIAYITNRGSVSNDTLTLLRAPAHPYPIAQTNVPPMRPGERRQFEIRAVLAATRMTAQSRDSMTVALYRNDEELDSGVSKGFDITAATFELRNVPGSISYPGTEQTIEVVVTNRTPTALPADSVTVCVFDIDLCYPVAIASVLIEPVPRDQTARFIIPLHVTRTADSGGVWAAQVGFDLRVCYGGTCRFADTSMQPDYEKFCDVRRLQHDVALTTNAVGRCGVGFMTDRLDILSFDTIVGTDVAVVTSLPGFEVRTPSGQEIPTTLVSNGAANRYAFRAAYTGRYYMMMQTLPGQQYTILLEPAAN